MGKARKFLSLVEAEREKVLSYEDALKTAKKVGASKAEGLPLLAQTIWTLSQVHRGINPKMVYDGALKKGLSAAEVRKLGPFDLGDLMFV